MNIADIEPGKFYDCEFETSTLLDTFGRPLNLSDAPLKGVGIYKGAGRITGRDLTTRMVEVFDSEINRAITMSFADVLSVRQA